MMALNIIQMTKKRALTSWLMRYLASISRDAKRGWIIRLWKDIRRWIQSLQQAWYGKAYVQVAMLACSGVEPALQDRV